MSVSVWVSSPDTRSERRFDLHLTVGNLKSKLELITGIPIGNQRLGIYAANEDTKPIVALEDDSKPLGFYGLKDWQWIKVEDTNPSVTFTGQLTDYSGVDKFELTEEQYAARQDSVLAYKQRHKVGRFAEKEEPAPIPIEHIKIPIGARCQVESTEPGLHKRGTVRFVGQTKFGSGTGVWVGVEYDEPFGKNDGSVNGERYFECKMKYGAFVRPEKVQVGDFPVEDLDFDDEEEI
ncbi:unnamed protein product [Peniophora sp. CBMAI 1063]|nr:unnamed protein product [Peniophora sp. CBMAI 1063]